MWDYKEELTVLTGLDKKVLDSYMKIYPALILHKAAEISLDYNGKTKDVKLEIPGVGYIIYRMGKNSYEFLPAYGFTKKLKKALKEGKSPLTELTEQELVKMINSKYKGIFD